MALEAGASVLAFVSLAGELSKLTIAAAQLWRQVEDVPTEISGLLEELRTLEETFGEIQTQCSMSGLPEAFWRSSSASRSFRLSTQARDVLSDLVEDLGEKLSGKKGVKRKAAAFRVVLKKETLASSEKRLTRSLRLLQLSMQSYQLAYTGLIPDITARKVTHGLVSELGGGWLPPKGVQRPDSHTTATEGVAGEAKSVVKSASHSRRYASSKPDQFALDCTKRYGAWQAQLRFPSWISQSIYQVHCSMTPASWKINLRVYNTVPLDAEIVQKVRNGDRAGVMKLFRSGQASPFDKDENGGSLLYYATLAPHYGMCQLLLQHGLQDNFDDPFASSSPLISLRDAKPRHPQVQEKFSGRSVTEQLAEVERTATLFRSYIQGPDAIPADGLLNCVSQFAFDNFVSTFQDMFMPDYYDLELSNRLEAVRLGAFNAQSDRTLRKFVSSDALIKRSDVRQSSLAKLSLVHSAAIALGCRLPDELRPTKKMPWVVRAYGEGWGMLVTDVLEASDAEDLHSFERVSPWKSLPVPAWSGTPLISLIGGALCFVLLDITMAWWDRLFQQTLWHWLELLQSAQVDLLEYGRREVQLLRDNPEDIRGAFDADAMELPPTADQKVLLESSQRIKFGRGKFESRKLGDQVPIRIIDFRIGSQPKDWRIIWAPEFEHMANQFWMMIEEPETAIPGAWIDE